MPAKIADQQPITRVENTEVAMSATETGSKVYKPQSYEEAINDLVYGRRCGEAIEDELDNLTNHNTWKYEELPVGKKAIGLKWVFKVNYNSNGSVERFKARLVAQGFSQVAGINFIETFAPTVRRELLRIFLAIATILGLIVHQVDIGAYLESLLDDNKVPM